MSIGASIVANGGRNVESWLLLAGGCAILFVADALREVEEASRELAVSTGHDLRETRPDVMASRKPSRIIIGLVLALLAVALAFSWPAISVLVYR